MLKYYLEWNVVIEIKILKYNAWNKFLDDS